MFFSKSFIASTLLGLAAATRHQGEMQMSAAAEQSTLASQVSPAAAMMESAATMMESAATQMPSAHMTAPAKSKMRTTTAKAAHTTTPLAAASSAVHSSMAMAAAPAAMMPAGGATVKTHVVKVGGPNGTLVFSPNNIVAQPGDLVQFQFNPKNHSVVQSTFDQPCVPIQNIMPNKTDAFFSGFMPTNASAVAAGSFLTYTIRVMDTKPIWYYCSQGMHCQAGMVGAINAATSGNKTVDAFKGLAKAAPENLTPGQKPGQGGAAAPPPPPPPPAAGTSTAAGAGAAGTGTPANTAAASSSSLPPQAAAGTNDASPVAHSLLMLGITLAAAFLVL